MVRKSDGANIEAGNLLRRIGEEEAALAEYRIAADRMSAAGDWLGAGDLLNQGGWPEVAHDYYQAGWQARSNAVPCAMRLAREKVITDIASAIEV